MTDFNPTHLRTRHNGWMTPKQFARVLTAAFPLPATRADQARALGVTVRSLQFYLSGAKPGTIERLVTLAAGSETVRRVLKGWK